MRNIYKLHFCLSSWYVRPLNDWKLMFMHVVWGLWAPCDFHAPNPKRRWWLAQYSVENEPNDCRESHIDRRFTASIMDAMSIQFILEVETTISVTTFFEWLCRWDWRKGDERVSLHSIFGDCCRSVGCANIHIHSL